jgi:septum formation protein
VRLVLASASPRRAELLRAAGFDFVVKAVTIDEAALAEENARELVRRLAAAKARAASGGTPGDVIVAADTVVVVDDDILGKPENDRDAAAMLRRLSGRTHQVLTGVAVRHGDYLATSVEETLVSFTALAPEEIAWYVASGEPRDKAGAYGIQGLASRFVHRIEGSYSNVVGLPVATLQRMLRDVGLLSELAVSMRRQPD